jgi:hypothetical protein
MTHAPTTAPRLRMRRIGDVTMTELLAPGTRVSYRLWASNPFDTGTVAAVFPAGTTGDIYPHMGNGGTVSIKRDGYRETVAMPLGKFTDTDYVRATDTDTVPTDQADRVNDDGITFAAWMAKVDRAIYARVGLSSDDLADACYWDSWADGVSPSDAAADAIGSDDMFTGIDY